MVIKIVQQEDSDWSWYGNLIDDVKAFLNARLEGSISFAHRRW